MSSEKVVRSGSSISKGSLGSASGATTELLSRRFRNKIARLLEKAGFVVDRRESVKPREDMVANALGIRIVVKCKRASSEDTPFPRLGSLIDEYSRKVKKEGATAAVLVLGGYRIGHTHERFTRTVKTEEELSRQGSVVIWDDRTIEYYSRTVNALLDYARYTILAELGIKKEFEKPRYVPAMKIVQGDRQFFVFGISPEVLLKVAYVFKKERDPRAYQRMLRPTRLRDEIAEFLKEPGATFPNSIICVFQSGVRFDGKRLRIPMSCGSVWIVDGQHRLYAFCHSTKDKRKNFKLVCSGFNAEGLPKSQLSIPEQGAIFVNINQKGKRVPSELLYDLYEMIGVNDSRVELVKELAKTEVFGNRIGFPSKKGTISSVTFITTSPMGRLVSTRPNGTLSRYYAGDQRKFYKFCFRALKGYFSIVAEVFGKEWNNPREYVLATDRGIRALLRLFESIVSYAEGVKTEKIRECLEALKGVELRSAELAKKGGYYGEGGANILRDEWVSQIRTRIPEFALTEKQTVVDQLVVLPGERDKAEEFLKKWFLILEGEIFAELAYIDDTTFSYLGWINPSCKALKIMVSSIKEREKCEKAAFELQRGRTNLEVFQKKVITKEGEEHEYEHERWLAGQNYEVELGHDLKRDSLGNKKHTIKVLQRPDLSERYRRFAEEWKTLPTKKAGVSIMRFFPTSGES
jgi:DGQHR domain-containing protein